MPVMQVVVRTWCRRSNFTFRFLLVVAKVNRDQLPVPVYLGLDLGKRISPIDELWQCGIRSWNAVTVVKRLFLPANHSECTALCNICDNVRGGGGGSNRTTTVVMFMIHDA